ncbi:DDE-type integrase/transposase/recombinase [Sulfitobacter sp. 1A13496]|uniref:DDE-type integrase/transposase/recombinase n=1 Tax=Sulfitobacter TaxID=60136 RepID=UPI0037470125
MTARRNVKVVRAFLRQARKTVRLYRPLTIITDQTHSYAKVIGEINERRGSDGAVRDVDRKYLNNWHCQLSDTDL